MKHTFTVRIGRTHIEINVNVFNTDEYFKDIGGKLLVSV